MTKRSKWSPRENQPAPNPCGRWGMESCVDMSRNLADCFEPDWNECEPCGSHKSGKACWGERRPARGARAIGIDVRHRFPTTAKVHRAYNCQADDRRDSSNAWVGPNVSMPQLC